MGSVKASVPSKSLFIRLKDNEVIRSPFCSDWIVLVRICGMEVENEKEVTLLVDYDFVSFIAHGHVLMGLDHRAELELGGVHLLVEFVKLSVSQLIVIHKIPLSATMLIAISVTFSWEINPFWMAEFISHEVEVALTA